VWDQMTVLENNDLLNANINSQNNTALNLSEVQDNGNSKYAYDIPTYYFLW